MVGEVSIKTVDASEFEENAVHQKNEVEEEGYMGGKVRQKLKTLLFFLFNAGIININSVHGHPGVMRPTAVGVSSFGKV